MVRAYSDDLRRKLLKAHRQGEGNLAQLAVRFRVSLSWARSISATLTRTERMECPAGSRRGPRSKLTEEVRKQLDSWSASQPDLTLVEMQRRLAQQRRLKVSIGRLWTVPREMGLRLKKSHSTLPNRIPKQSVASVPGGNKRRAISIPRG